jgi:cbb3-type cytochrome oxidase subunit 3
MRLSELVARLTPSTFAQISLVIFLVVFVSVVARVLRRKNRAGFELARHLPLDDGERREVVP